MKRNILVVTLLAAAAIMTVSCEKDSRTETPDPVFPSLVENYAVQPGETLDLTFTPNLDWKISIPSDVRQWFWIKDGSFNVTELAGKASSSPVTVKIGVIDTQEFDRNTSCDVSLAMGGKTQVIAKYMLPAKERSIEVYAAQWGEDGALSIADDGISYVYGSVPAESLELRWSAIDADFRAPVRVDANCEWSVELPDWAEVNVPESTTGTIEVVFKGESVRGGEGTLVFKAGNGVLKEIPVSIPSCSDVKVFTAVLSDGEFEYGEGGEYLWSAEPVSHVDMAWLGSDFRMPVKVDSKCSWTMELPEWLTVEVPEKTTGEISLTLLGVPSEYPLEGADGKIAFINGDDILTELTVTIPPCQDIMTFSIDMSLTELEYNYLGEVNTTAGYISAPATARLSGVEDVRVFAVETTGGKLGAEDPDWFRIESSKWNSASGADVIQERTLTFVVSENTGEARSAVLFVLPPGIKVETADLFDSGASVKAEYEEYSVQVTQGTMHYDDYITIKPVEAPEFAYSFEKVSAQKQEELTAVFGTAGHVYVMTYESPYSRDNAFMTMAVPFASYKVFGSADLSDDRTEDAGFWLEYSNAGDADNYGVIDMYREGTLPTEQSVGYVVFYSSTGEVLAIVECLSPYVPAVLEIDRTSLMFASEAASHSVAVTSNVEWTAVSDASWCMVSPSAGNGDGNVVISVSENEASEVRTATVTISSATVSHTVSVEQKFGEVLEVGTTDLEFGFAASSQKISVAANVEWTIESGADWCIVDPASGTAGSDVTVSVKRNTSDAVRTTVLTLRAGSLARTVNVMQNMDDGSLTNGDGQVHFVDWSEAKKAGASLERLTSGDIYKEYRSGNTPVYHLTYTKTSSPLRIVLPAEVKKHNVNPWANSGYFRVNDTNCYEYFGPNDILGEVVMDSDSSVAIYMDLPEGKKFLRGNINFTTAASDNPVIILVCTIDTSAE